MSILLADLVAFVVGIGLTLAFQRVQRRLALRREARARCGWCGRLRPHKPGQACEACLASMNGASGGGPAQSLEGFSGAGAAGPAEWPRA